MRPRPLAISGLLLSIVYFALVGLTGPSGPFTAAAQATGAITASPNPCTIPGGSTTCGSTISWNTSGATSASVTLQDLSGGSEQVFASGLSGNKVAQISAPPHRLVFRLYDTSSGSPQFLDATEALAIGTGTINASPNPCTISGGASVCSTTITWSTSNVTTGQVTVQDSAGGGEVNFASGTSGSQSAQLQAPPHQYTFRLYDASSGTRYLLTATTAVATGAGGIDAFPNPCTIPGGSTVCATDVTWNAQNVVAAKVTEEDAVGGGELFFASGVSGVETGFLQAPPHIYFFRLYDVSIATPFWLAGTTAFAVGTGQIDVDPTPCPILGGETSCAATVDWSTANVSAAQVTVQDSVGGGEVFFASGASGSVPTVLEGEPHQYTFRLYDVSSGTSIWLASYVAFATTVGGIVAHPNPCGIPSGSTSCQTTISWNALDTSLAEVTVEDVVGGGELFFASGVLGSQTALIEPPPHRYIFRLYDTFAGRSLIDQVEVSAAGAGVLLASPNPCPVVSPATSCTVTITWSTAEASAAEITVEDAVGGAGQTLFTSGLSGNQTAQIQVPPHAYTFRLYDISSGSRIFLAATTVIGTGTGTITGSPNPCAISAGSTTCLANIEWSTETVGSAQVTRQDAAGGGEVVFASGISGVQNDLLEAPPHQYTYRLYDISSGSRVFLDAVTVVTVAPPPAAPTNLTAVAGSTGSGPKAQRFVDLSWQDNSNNETSFDIERCKLTGKGKSTSCPFALLTTVGANATAYHDASVARSTTYRYRVRARAGSAVSSYSNVVEVKTP